MTAMSLISIACQAALLLAGMAQAKTPDDALPPFISYSFVPQSTPAFSFAPAGAASVISGRTVTDCMHLTAASFTPGSFVGNAAIVATNTGSGCLPNPAFSNGFYLVQPGTVSNGAMTFESYTISPPEVKATNFASTGQMLYVRPPTAGFLVYTLSGGNLLQATAAGLAPAAGAYVRTGLGLQDLTAPVTYVLVPVGSTVPKPVKQLVKATAATQCGGAVAPEAVVGDFAVVTSQADSGECYTEGDFNNDAYLVQAGQLVGGGQSFEAYQVSPPLVQASQYVASNSVIYWYSGQGTSVVVSMWNGTDFTQSPAIPTSAGNFINTGVTVDGLTAPMVFVVQPQAVRVSKWVPVSPTVEGAWLAGSSVYSLTARQFNVAASPFLPTRDWAYAPGSSYINYGTMKRFFAVQRTDGREGIVWQDVSSRSVFMTWLSPDLLSHSTTQIFQSTDFLEAASSDGAGQIVLLMLSGARTPLDKNASIPVYLVKVNSATGAQLALAQLNTFKVPGLDVHGWSTTGASLAWSTTTGTIGVVLARFKTVNPAGLNHQGCVAFVVSAATLQVVTNLGQTSGHCMANSLGLDSTGNFLGADQGDNFPRGVNLWRFNSGGISNRVVYNYKAMPGVTPANPASVVFPVYAAVSTPTQRYYQWSNDNNVYTEIAHPAVVEVADSLLVFFSSELPDPLNVAKTGTTLNAPRNAAFIRVPKAIPSTAVLSPGPVAVGGFYDFIGTWTPQQNQGIVQLTQFSTLDQSATRFKTARLAPGKNVLYWEVWSATAYNHSQIMVVDDAGNVVLPPTSLAFPLQLPATDDPRVVGTRTVFYAGTPDGKLARYELCVQDGCSAVPQTPAVVSSLLQSAEELQAKAPHAGRPLAAARVMRAVRPATMA